MVDDVVDDCTKLPAIETREGSRHAYQSRHGAIAPVGGMPQTEVVKHLEVGGADDVMCLIDEYKLETRRVELVQSIAGRDALYGGDGDVRGA